MPVTVYVGHYEDFMTGLERQIYRQQIALIRQNFADLRPHAVKLASFRHRSVLLVPGSPWLVLSRSLATPRMRVALRQTLLHALLHFDMARHNSFGHTPEFLDASARLGLGECSLDQCLNPDDFERHQPGQERGLREMRTYVLGLAIKDTRILQMVNTEPSNLEAIRQSSAIRAEMKSISDDAYRLYGVRLSFLLPRSVGPATE